MQKNKVFVASGSDIPQASLSDTNDINIKELNQNGEPIWDVFNFDTVEEADAFRMGLAMGNEMERYWV